MPPTPIHPTEGFGEKLGGLVLSCATTGIAHAPTRAATMLPASATCSLKVNIDIAVLLLRRLFPHVGKTIRATFRYSGNRHYTWRLMACPQMRTSSSANVGLA